MEEIRLLGQPGIVNVDSANSRRVYAGQLVTWLLQIEAERISATQQVEVCRAELVKADQQVQALAAGVVKQRVGCRFFRIHTSDPMCRPGCRVQGPWDDTIAGVSGQGVQVCNSWVYVIDEVLIPAYNLE